MAEERLNRGSGTPEEPKVLPETAVEVPEEAVQEPEVESAVVQAGEILTAEDTDLSGIGETPEEHPEVTLDEVLENLSDEKCVSDEIPAVEKPVGTKKLKWWYIALPVVLVLAILVAIFWRPISVYLAPKAALAQALAKTGEALAARNEGTPLAMMSKAYDETGRNTVEFSLDFAVDSDSFSEELKMDMTVQSDAMTRQSQVAATVDVAGQELDMNMYIDPEMMALNLEQYTGDTYLGIVYDTFGEDIRKNEFLYDAIGEESVQMIEEYVQMIDDALSMEQLTEEQMEKSLKAYGQVILDFIEQKDAEVGKEDVSLDGTKESCYAITFQISEKELGELYERMIDVAEEDPVALYYYQSYNLEADESDWKDYLEAFREDAEELQSDGEGECEVVFYLYEDQVAMIEMDYVSEGMGDDGEWIVSLNFGKNAAESDLICRVEIPEGEDEGAVTLTLSTEKDGDEIRERIVIASDDDESEAVTLGYDWDRKSGEFTLFAESGDPEDDPGRYEIQGTLTEEENGYSISFPNIMEMFTDAFVEDMDVELDMSIDISVATGAEIKVPEITDITGLSQMDLYQMLAKVIDI